MSKSFTVLGVTAYIKKILTNDYVLKNVCVEGEVSNCKYHYSSGHIYFTLKDDKAKLECVMYAGNRINGLDFELKDGMEVKASGRIDLYEPKGGYQLNCIMIEKIGVGGYYEQFEQLKNKLQAEGLFSEEHKKAIPKFITRLGIITSNSGMAIGDIVVNTFNRNPHMTTYLYPAKVEGQGSAESLIKGIRAMESIKPDCIVIGRGGGAYESLISFNDERLARVIYDCEIPIIACIGHEYDFTIADFVADYRASTPTGAAQKASFDYEEFQGDMVDYHYRLVAAISQKIDAYKNKSKVFENRLKVSSPGGRLENYKRRTKDLSATLKRIMHDIKLVDSRNKFSRFEKLPSQLMNDKLEQTKQRLLIDIEKLNVVSPLNKLEAGYSYVTDENGRNIDSVDKVRSGDRVNIRMKDGSRSAVVE